MIIVRAPLRISLGGGGTDLPSWYSQHGAFFISATIDKYIYLTGSERVSDKKIWLGYSQTEVCDHVSEIKHTFFRECLAHYEQNDGIEIHSISEVAGNSGLGSSGAFLVGVLTLLNAMKKVEMTRNTLAELACELEMKNLGRASGKQDQYISAIGGITAFTMDRAGNVGSTPVGLSPTASRQLENNLLLYFSGLSRDSGKILADQGKAFQDQEKTTLAAMHEIQEIGHNSLMALKAENFDQFGELLHRHWLAKKRMSGMSDVALDETYDFARTQGALGGKLIGAGGGGYWMFYVPAADQQRFRQAATERGLREMPWRFEVHGCTVVHAD